MHPLLRGLIVVGVAATVAFGISLIGGFVAAVVRNVEGPEFKAAFVRSAIESCTKEAVKGGAPEAKAVPYCTWFAQDMAGHHTGGALAKDSLSVNPSQGHHAV